jgi:putative nucleotidyltransferase with HDIG domain
VGFPPSLSYLRYQPFQVQSAVHSYTPVGVAMSADRILVVDDEEPIREIVCSMLNSANFVCSQASSGKEALALLDSGEDYELMLSDLMMAGMDGVALLEATKERFPDMPVVMVTAVHDVSVALSAIRNGAYDYLLKPFEREQLLATVRRALENRRLKLENRAYQTNLEALVTARTEQLRQAVTTLERSYDITLEALGNALDLKDAETEGHSKRVTAFTIAIARAMGLTSDQIRVIARGAFLHDIGKMAIPDAILRKPGALDPEEAAIMREHCYRGYQILRRIPFLTEASEIVYSHQEKFDGTGYPRGLKGEEIPLGSRIFSVADTLDAITSNRPYRAAQTLSAAREEIHRWSGRQFDPEVVKVFLSMPENIWSDLRKDIDAQINPVAYSATARG